MKLAEKQKVIELRKKGMTLSEIQKLVPAAKSTISLWVRDIVLSKDEQKRISKKITDGQAKSREILRNKAVLRQNSIDAYAEAVFDGFKVNKQIALLFCACLYECEGGKTKHGPFNFTNSNPYLVQVFLKLLRNSFDLNEAKFSLHLHLHTYHNEQKQLLFWSNITKVPQHQFIKTYIKKTSGMYKSEGYPGCITIRYYDVSLKRKLLAIFKKLDKYI